MIVAGNNGQEPEEPAMGDLFQPWHIILIVLVALVLFGGRRLPELGKGLGEGLRGFKEGLKGVSSDEPVKPAAAKSESDAETK
jgi:sec-independent protein translocase protein TatA